jgi:hypothetical protein
VLNRIRRAVSLARARYAPKGRHRRHLTPSLPTVAPTFPASADASRPPLGRFSDGADHRLPLAGEDTALVRPYVLAWEERVRPRAVIVASHLPPEAWATLAGAG